MKSKKEFKVFNSSITKLKKVCNRIVLSMVQIKFKYHIKLILFYVNIKPKEYVKLSIK